MANAALRQTNPLAARFYSCPVTHWQQQNSRNDPLLHFYISDSFSVAYLPGKAVLDFSVFIQQ
jgi:hypothetical protein